MKSSKPDPNIIAAKLAFAKLPGFADARLLRDGLIAAGLCANDFTSVAQVFTDDVHFDRHARTPGVDCAIPDDLPFIDPPKSFKEYQAIHAAKYHTRVTEKNK